MISLAELIARSRKLAGMLQGTMALEGAGLNREQLREAVRENAAEIASLHDAVRVDVEWLRRALEERAIFNAIPLEKIAWFRDGKWVDISPEQIDNFTFTGLSNTDFLRFGIEENEDDVAAAREAMKETSIPWDDVKAELGLLDTETA